MVAALLVAFVTMNLVMDLMEKVKTSNAREALYTERLQRTG